VTDEVWAFAVSPGSVPRIDTSLANVARAWNYMVGGKDNFEVDREAARQLMEVAPVIRIAAPASRAFLRRAVRYLAGDAGIRQFLDIGTGLPTAGNTHEIAQAAAPECRVVYVDNDPVVLVHARALLTSDPSGVTSYIDADARDPDTILRQAGATLDFAEPVAIMMVDLLNFIDDEAAASILPRLAAAVVPGSYLAIMHPASDLDPALLEAEQRWNELGAQPVRLRSREHIISFLAGLELVEPGLVTVLLTSLGTRSGLWAALAGAGPRRSSCGRRRCWNSATRPAGTRCSPTSPWPATWGTPGGAGPR
jgi:O-methyltransferase involved in polyketide biosynthesis